MLDVEQTTNQRLRVLTIISAIFLPLTLIAGIYGMNFQNMPELDESYAYFAVLAAMGAFAGGLLFWFWWKGWLE